MAGGYYFAGGDECEGTTKFLEPIIDNGRLTHFNYSGPGNPICAQYQQEHPPIQYINGQRTHSDEIALKHDIAYTNALQVKDPAIRQKMIRKADMEYIQEHERYPNEPGKLGLAGIRAKVAAEKYIPGAKRLIGDYSGGKKRK